MRVILEDRQRRIGERVVAYGASTGDDPAPASLPWPYTPEKLAAQQAWLRAERMAALEEIRRIAATTRPDPDGLTFLDYLHDDDDPPPGEGRG